MPLDVLETNIGPTPQDRGRGWYLVTHKGFSLQEKNTAGGRRSEVGFNRTKTHEPVPKTTRIYSQKDVDEIIVEMKENTYSKETSYSQKEVDQIVQALVTSYEERMLNMRNEIETTFNKKLLEIQKGLDSRLNL